MNDKPPTITLELTANEIMTLNDVLDKQRDSYAREWIKNESLPNGEYYRQQAINCVRIRALVKAQT